MDVARQFVRLAWNGEEPEGLTHMRLQKLLYYAQGWHLAAFGRPLFVGRIEAWKHGPVVKEVYPRFVDRKASPISPDDAGEPSLSDQDRAFVEAVWGEYKQFSGNGLRDMTHREPPWLEARVGKTDGDSCDEEITHAAMQSYFAGLLEGKLIPGLSVEASYRAVEESSRKRGRPHREVFASLRSGRP